jgi:hypothetical protein
MAITAAASSARGKPPGGGREGQGQMIISETWMPLLVSAVRDAVVYNEGLLRSETLSDRSDYEEHHMVLLQFFEYVKEEYRKVESSIGLPLHELLHEQGQSASVAHLPPKE